MELKNWMKQAYNDGIELSKQFDNEQSAINNLPLIDLEKFLSFEYEQFFHAGFINREPEYVRAIRYGKIPENGQSKNYANNSFENGISCVKIIRNESDYSIKSIYDVTLGYQEIDKIIIEGWYLGQSGSDGEPLLICAKQI